MNDNTAIWRDYYAKALARAHAPRTAFAAGLNQTGLRSAIDCGCGTGSDIAYLAQLGYQVHGFDINPDAISICQKRFACEPRVALTAISFEAFDYPVCALVIANASLYFAAPSRFQATWQAINTSLVPGGVFAGDFMGVNDSWASGYRSPTTALSREQVQALFSDYEIVQLDERDEQGKTLIGKIKHWHSFSVVAIKRA